MEHDRKCEFKTWGAHWLHLDFLTEEELGTIRAHMLCFCASRRAQIEVTQVMEGSLKDRWRLVRDNYREKVVAEEREQARLRLSGGEREDGGTASVTRLDEFRKRRDAQSSNDASD